MNDYRNCGNCWWSNCGNLCLFLAELKNLQPDAKKNLCWGWRPNEKDEKIAYLEKYGREVERIGKLPSIL